MTLPGHRGNVISLFSGVGMAELALERCGWLTIKTAEIDPFCRSILAMRFPAAIHESDVRDVTIDSETLPGGTELFERPLMVVGGFPCQDISGPGTGAGLSGARSGLVHEQLRVIAEFLPDYALFENSPMLRSRGLGEIVSQLVNLGYFVRWECLPAAGVGAIHLRNRCWIMARRRRFAEAGVEIGDFGAGWLPSTLPRSGRTYYQAVFETKPLITVRDARRYAEALHGRTLLPTPTKSDGTGGPGTTPKRTGGKNLRTVAAEMTGNGRLNPSFVEWMMGLPLGWTDPCVLLRWDAFRPVRPPMTGGTVGCMTTTRHEKHRSARIQALGNGLVPGVAELALRLLTDA